MVTWEQGRVQADTLGTKLSQQTDAARSNKVSQVSNAHLEHFAGALAVAGRQDRRVHQLEAGAAEKLVRRVRERAVC